MSGRSRYWPGICLLLGTAVSGCQWSGEGSARAPSFGIDSVPAQTEPELEALERDSPRSPRATSDDRATGSAGRKGNLLTRLISEPEKPAPERVPLPVNKRTPASDTDEPDF
jgi:hypothetical protein